MPRETLMGATTDLTTRIAELASLIEARLAEDEAVARVLCAGAWGSHPWAVEKCSENDCECIVYQGEYKPFTEAQIPPIQYVADGETPEHAAHIARNDPARTLRRVKATRELVAVILAEPHDWIPGDEFYSCSQAAEMNPVPEPPGEPGSGCSDPERAGQPCDCGRDQRVARLLSIIASEWEVT
jgi:hypothetical protein